MMKKKTVKYGEIYYFDFGEHKETPKSGVKPIIVIQDNRLNEVSPTTIVALIEVNAHRCFLPTHMFLEDIRGVDAPAMILLEQVSCVNQHELGEFIGVIDDAVMMRKLKNGLKKVFGMWDYTPKGSADVRCLCSRCVQSYMQTGRYIVRRLDPFSSKKDSCDKCNALGYDYVLVERTKSEKKQMCKSDFRTFVMEGRNE